MLEVPITTSTTNTPPGPLFINKWRKLVKKEEEDMDIQTCKNCGVDFDFDKRGLVATWAITCVVRRVPGKQRGKRGTTMPSMTNRQQEETTP